MRFTIATWIWIIALACTTARSEVGDHYDDAVKKHGNPIGKMVSQNQITYVFQSTNSTLREVFNRQGICIKSDHPSTKPLSEEITEPAPNPEPNPEPQPKAEPKPEPQPNPEPSPEPNPEPEAAKQPSTALRITLLLLPLLCIITAFVFIRKKIQRRLNLSSVSGLQNQKIDTNLSGEKADSKSTLPNSCHREASRRLSRNEMCFFKALHEAVMEDYIATFHVSLDRIVNIPDSDQELPFVDFVLHNPYDTSVAAAIILYDAKNEQAHQASRRKTLQKILKESGIPLIEMHMDYQYNPIKIREKIEHSSLPSTQS